MEKYGGYPSAAIRPIFNTEDFLRKTTAIRALYEAPKKRQCEKLVDFCETTSCHGLGHIVNPKELFVLRISWTVIVAAFLAIASYLVYLSAANLANRSLTSEILTNFKEATAAGMDLPDIHICDASIFNMTRLDELGFDGTMATYLTLATSENAPLGEFMNKTEEHSMYNTKLALLLAQASTTVKDVIESAAIQCTDMLLGCTKAGQWLTSKQCCDTYFNPVPFVTIFGSCISTHGKPIRQIYESRDAGFVVYALPNSKHIINFNESLIKAEYILQQGLYYAVSNPASHPESVLHTNGRFAWPNAWVSAPISKSMVDNSELKQNYLAPYVCVDSNDPEIRRLKTPEYDYYTEQNCYYAMYQKNFQRFFNCSAAFMNHGNSTTQFCDPGVFVALEWDSTGPNDVCPIECVNEYYDVTPSYAQINKDLLISKYHLTALENSTQDLVVLHFFYSSFTYQIRISHTSTIIKWLGEVGGNMGLFLGASLITITEVIALCFRCCVRSRA